jgi:hypothetical protein
MDTPPYGGWREEITMIEFRVHDLDELAHRVATEGIDAHPVAVIELAHAAHDLGVSQVLIDVLVDPAEPEPARLRALGRIASTLSLLAASASPGPQPVKYEGRGLRAPAALSSAAVG